MKIIDDVGDDEIQDIAIPTGIPIIYNFDRDLNPIKPSVEQGAVSQVHMSGVFLEKPGTCLPICLFFQTLCVGALKFFICHLSLLPLLPTGLFPGLLKQAIRREVEWW